MTNTSIVPINENTRLTGVIWSVLMLVVAVTPIVFSTAGFAVYLGPQSNFFQVGMLFAATLAGLSAALGDPLPARLVRHRGPVLIAAAGVAWSAIVTITSVRPAISHEAPFTMFCYAVLFVGVLAYGRRGSALPIAALLAPSTLNSVVVLLQATHVWSPVPWMAEGKLANIGFLGNPNITGAYLQVPTVAAVASVFAFRRLRIPLILAALLHLAAVIAVQAVSAATAICVGLIAMAAVSRSRKVLVTVAALLIAGAIFVTSYEPTQARIRELSSELRARNYVAFSSHRLPADVVAAEMFRERPLFGMGPGAFSAQYMQYRLAVDEKYPSLLDAATRTDVIFETVHNDHLQLLAESGLPGYLLAVALAFGVARYSFVKRANLSDQSRFVALFAFPAVIAFATVTLAQFPLEVTAAASSVLYGAALCHVWSRDAAG